MKLVRKIIITVLCLQIILVAIPMRASACDCYVPDNALEGLEKSDAVFTGKVKDIKKTKINGEAYYAVLIEVDRTWKGIKESQIIVYTDWSSCMFEFQKDEEYLLYSYKNDDKYFVMNCGRSTTIQYGKEDIAQLGPGINPSEQVNLSFEFYNLEWITGSVVTVLIFLCASIIIRRRNSKNK